MLELYVTGVEQKNDKVFTTTGLASTMQSLGYGTGVYKPVVVGALENDGYLQSKDLLFVKAHDIHIKTYFTYLLKEAISPILSAANEKLAAAQAALEKLIAVDKEASEMTDVKAQAFFYKDSVKVAMEELRTPCDELEMIVDKEIWPIPTYGELMFEV